MTNAELLTIAEARILQCWKEARKHFKKLETVIAPAVKLNSRLTATAGRAFLQQHYIDLSPELFRNNLEEFESVTIPHEVAHIVAYAIFKDEGHGEGWRFVMTNVYGIEARRCHNMETNTGRERKRFHYVCGICGEDYSKIGPIVHKRIQENTKGYRCKCGSPMLAKYWQG